MSILPLAGFVWLNAFKDAAMRGEVCILRGEVCVCVCVWGRRDKVGGGRTDEVRPGKEEKGNETETECQAAFTHC